MLLREAARLDKAAENPGRETVATISDKQLTEIANMKLPDINALDIQGAKLQVAGTARSMGIEVEGY